jgi:hypothetical protein
MATPANRNGLWGLVPDHTIASTAATRLAAGGLISAADVGRRPIPAPQIEPVLESTLTPAGWLHVADVLEAKAAELETSDLEITQIYRSNAARIRAQWRRN